MKNPMDLPPADRPDPLASAASAPMEVEDIKEKMRQLLQNSVSTGRNGGLWPMVKSGLLERFSYGGFPKS